MITLPLLLSEWIRDNAWEPIVVSSDFSIEANDNLCRLQFPEGGASTLSWSEFHDAINVYVDVKRQQVIDGNLGPHLLYIWHDEMAGSVCLSCISGTFLPQGLFSCKINTSVSLESILRSFVSSSYLDGIPLDELRVISEYSESIVEADSSNFTLDVFTKELP